MGIYDRVKELCAEQNVSVLSIEEALGFPRSSICKWNDHIPSAHKIADVAKVLNVSIEDLLVRNNEVHP